MGKILKHADQIEKPSTSDLYFQVYLLVQGWTFHYTALEIQGVFIQTM